MDKGSETSLHSADSFGQVPMAKTSSSIPSLSTSHSSDSDMAQYNRKHRTKPSTRNQKALAFAGFNVFNQCFDHSVTNVDAVIADLAKLTKDILPTISGVRNDSQQPNRDDVEETHEVSVEIGEDEILRYGYNLERV